MPEYQLELKQIVDYPRCRIYRQFIRTLMKDQSIRISGGSGLFYFTVLCSYANFRTSYRRLDGVSYSVYPGEWICHISEVSEWFRTRFHCQALAILDRLQEKQLISYSTLGRGDKLVKFKIKGWRHHNTILDYNAPCQKDSGFFFMPISTAAELVGSGKCAEMDCLLDLWMNTIYNDSNVQGSEIGPVVYMRNGTGNPLLGYADLALRWGISKATVGRFLKRMEGIDYLSLLSFPGSKGSVIYLQNYLSTMFQISDVLIDKEEVAMVLNIKIASPDDEEKRVPSNTDSAVDSVSREGFSVSKPQMDYITTKVAKILATQGFSCFECQKAIYKLYPLFHDCREDFLKQQTDSNAVKKERFMLCVSCRDRELFRFELTLTLCDGQQNRRN